MNWDHLPIFVDDLYPSTDSKYRVSATVITASRIPALSEIKGRYRM